MGMRMRMGEWEIEVEAGVEHTSFVRWEKDLVRLGRSGLSRRLTGISV